MSSLNILQSPTRPPYRTSRVSPPPGRPHPKNGEIFFLCLLLHKLSFRVWCSQCLGVPFARSPGRPSWFSKESQLCPWLKVCRFCVQALGLGGPPSQLVLVLSRAYQSDTHFPLGPLLLSCRLTVSQSHLEALILQTSKTQGKQVAKVSPNCSGLPLLSEEEYTEEIKSQEAVMKKEEELNCDLFCCSICEGIHLSAGNAGFTYRNGGDVTTQGCPSSRHIHTWLPHVSHAVAWSPSVSSRSSPAVCLSSGRHKCFWIADVFYPS
ncbi:uncharacterized protein LOC107502736 [Rousettus aegyptiacus]|uniref:uncharacterized protein LOC107502736 n=1 Tax=Rousettus aegyptiacus TaxID=9407 RepID=UPI00168D1E45|nr:uncharacterized protein LOC107502736 [Rousettus aegyptiacus]